MKRLLTILGLLAWTVTAMAAISYKGYVGVGNTTANCSTAVTVPAGATFAVIGILGLISDVGEVPTVVKLNNKAATLVFALDSSDGWGCETWTYRVKGFSTGSVNFVARWGSNPEGGMQYGITFFSGVDSTTPVRAYGKLRSAGPGYTYRHTPPIASSATDYLVVTAGTSPNIGFCRMGAAYGQTPVDSGQYSIDYGFAYKAEAVGSDSAWASVEEGTIIGVMLQAQAAAPPAGSSIFFLPFFGD